MNTPRNLTDTQPDRDTSIDVYHAAFVAGGTRRMVDVAITHLALRNQILVSHRGQLTAVQGARVSGAVETAVYRMLTPTASGAAVYQRLEHDPDIETVAAAYSAGDRNRGGATHCGKLAEELAGVAVFGFGAVVDPLLRSALTLLGSAGDTSARWWRRWWDSGGSGEGSLSPDGENNDADNSGAEPDGDAGAEGSAGGAGCGSDGGCASCGSAVGGNDDGGDGVGCGGGDEE